MAGEWKKRLLLFPAYSVIEGKCTCGKPANADGKHEDGSRIAKHPACKWKETATSDPAKTKEWMADPP